MGLLTNTDSVIERVNKSKKLEINDIKGRTWLFDVLYCVNKINMPEFTLKDMYYYENELKSKHPDNNNIRPKIRQQLQLLRDKGFIEFLGNGRYRKNL